MTDKLKTLLERCKCSVSVEVNKHRDYYQSATDYIEEAEAFECPPEIAPEVRRTMIETDTVISIQFYPDTPIGSYDVWHFNLDEALKQCLECISQRGARQ